MPAAGLAELVNRANLRVKHHMSPASEFGREAGGWTLRFYDHGLMRDRFLFNLFCYLRPRTTGVLGVALATDCCGVLPSASGNPIPRCAGCQKRPLFQGKPFLRWYDGENQPLPNGNTVLSLALEGTNTEETFRSPLVPFLLELLTPSESLQGQADWERLLIEQQLVRELQKTVVTAVTAPSGTIRY